MCARFQVLKVFIWNPQTSHFQPGTTGEWLTCPVIISNSTHEIVPKGLISRVLWGGVCTTEKETLDPVKIYGLEIFIS